MKNCSQLRKEARSTIIGNGWFWRLVVVAVLLQTITMLVAALLNVGFEHNGLQTWNDFLTAKMQARVGGLEYSVPSSHVAWQMTGASVFETFIMYIFSAITMFGVATAILKALGNDSNQWLSRSFGGFAKPLELAWLMVLVNLKVFFWTLLFIVPGIVACYRYRQSWFLKVENPDWSASKCISESSRMMKGNKRKAFALDVSYLGWLMVASAAVMAISISVVLSAHIGNSPISLVPALVSVPSVMLLVYIFWYYMAGRAVFYREIKDFVSEEQNKCYNTQNIEEK